MPGELRNEIIKKYPTLKNLITEKSDNRWAADTVVKFEKDTLVNSQQELDNILKSLGGCITGTGKASGGTRYKNCGFIGNWNQRQYMFLLKGLATGHQRKAFTPNKLGLKGKSYNNDSTTFRSDIISGLTQICVNDPAHLSGLISLIDNIETGTPVNQHFLNLKTEEIKKIMCDFGEVLAAYREHLNGAGTIRFSAGANEKIADYYTNEEIRSVKGPGAGGALNLKMYEAILRKETSVYGKFLHSLAFEDPKHKTNRNAWFLYSSQICPWLTTISEWIGGTTMQDVEKYVKNNTFDNFYNLLYNDTFPGVGLPTTTDQKDLWKKRWEAGDTNPIYFTLNTLMNKWGQSNADTIDEITKIMKKMFTTEKFVYIALDGVNIKFKDSAFTDVTHWGTEYHSNAQSAWNNWMGVMPLGSKQ